MSTDADWTMRKNGLVDLIEIFFIYSSEGNKRGAEDILNVIAISWEKMLPVSSSIVVYNVLTDFFPNYGILLDWLRNNFSCSKCKQFIQILKDVAKVTSKPVFINAVSCLLAVGAVYDTVVDTLQAFTHCKVITEAEDIVKKLQAMVCECDYLCRNLESLVCNFVPNSSSDDCLNELKTLKHDLDTQINDTSDVFEQFIKKYEGWEKRQAELLKVHADRSYSKSSAKVITGVAMLAGASILTGGISLIVAGSAGVTALCGLQDYWTAEMYSQALVDLKELNQVVERIKNNIESLGGRCSALQRRLENFHP